MALYPDGHKKILVGCAPCQPYSVYNKKKGKKDKKWQLLSILADLICEVNPEIVSMENVPNLVNYRGGCVYQDFVQKLKSNFYHVKEYPQLYCPEYGIPQQRTRLVLFASKLGPIEIIPPTHTPKEYQTVRERIGQMEPIKAGEISSVDPMHRASKLSHLNFRRIRMSRPGGTWRDWDDKIVAPCHRKSTGNGYVSVYGRMDWEFPSPTITTQFFGFGNGRFGHPEQDRAISLREGALLQTFPENYAFVEPGRPYHFKVLGRHIGNAVPVELGRVIARSIRGHIQINSKSPQS